MSDRGVAYVAYGAAARREMQESARTLLEYHHLPVVTAPGMTGAETDRQKSRLSKTRLLDWAPWEQVLYLDADTRVYDGLLAGFGMLDDGWEMVLTPSANQYDDWLWHVDAKEREDTRRALGFEALVLQAGVMFVRRTAAVERLFRVWQDEYRGGEDQAALLRAYWENPVKVWLLGRPWNGGAVIGHLFGRTRQ